MENTVEREASLKTDNNQASSDRGSLYRQILNRLIQIPNATKNDLNKIKIDVCREFHVSIPKNSEILQYVKPEERSLFHRLLQTKPIRTLSGVNVVAVMTSPYQCPHGKCAYCPGGPQHNVPAAYTGHEPATMRGIQNEFDPYLQVKNRMDQLKAIGHDVNKIELIIMGGTFPARPINYQKFFVKKCLDAISRQASRSLAEAQRNAERSLIRNVGITFETRPDYCKELHVDQMLQLGGTRVEIGVQTLYDDVYRRVKRGHTVQDVVDATRIAKDAGLKICYHMMPGMPGVSFDQDLEAFQTIINDSNFRPDMLKIYPCLVLRSAEIYRWWKRGTYKPYTLEEVTSLLVEVKKRLPTWIRVMRIQRDIPAKLIVAGVKKGNLREIVQRELGRRGSKCRCIRCREVGHRMLNEFIPKFEDVNVTTLEYNASEGTEQFISVEDEERDVLVGYLRLRFPSSHAHRPEVRVNDTAIVRELHVYGPLVPLGSRNARAWQHQGYGKRLLQVAERASLTNGRQRIIITSAIGVRQYFKQLGYCQNGPYMEKALS
jgi:elongator complex protein 3